MPWNPTRDQQEAIANLQQRVQSIEGGLQQIIAILSNPPRPTPKSTSAPSRFAAREPACGMGRSLECIDDLPTESDWVFRAGEVDTFCELQPNKQQVRFRNLVQQFERELQDSLKNSRAMRKPIKPSMKNY